MNNKNSNVLIMKRSAYEQLYMHASVYVCLIYANINAACNVFYTLYKCT